LCGSFLPQDVAEFINSLLKACPGGSELEVLAKLQQLAAEIPWGHHMLLLDRIPDAKARLSRTDAPLPHDGPTLGWITQSL
jgi:hypothetical protein